MLARPPRGNTVRAFHGLKNIRDVPFAELLRLQLSDNATCLLSTKDKTACVLLASPGSGDTPPSRQRATGVIQALYRIESGWHIEYQQLLTVPELQRQSHVCGRSLQLPRATDDQHELFRSVHREHVHVERVAGIVHIKHGRRGGAPGHIRNERSTFWRETIDLDLFKVVTDAPVTSLCD
ncbi:hypothetical protein WJX74_009790 [Apatococcus lobatus]|uniref:Uncharacterized protein n=1 Tax=Apatococcus lobatus TaxID=904363 RepID=A0AAW1QY65_9CHLO